MPTLSVDLLLKLLGDKEDEVRQAFLDFIAAGGSQQTVEDAIQKVLENQVEQALHLLDYFIEHFADVIPNVINSVGTETAQELTDVFPQPGVAIVFNPGDARAAEIAAESRNNFIQGFTEQQYAATRQAISRGITSGAGTQAMARSFRDSIGLTEQQESYVASYRQLLESRDARALDRALRDARYDGALQRAISLDRPLSQNQIDTMVGRYQARALAMRADTIAQTEALRAFSQGREEALQQMVEQTGIRRDRVERIWNATHDDRVRAWHLTMQGQRRGLDEPFVDGLGNDVAYPGDPAAPPETCINCRCTVTYDITPVL